MAKLFAEDDYYLLANIIAEARGKTGLTQAELGARMGASQKFVSVVETGMRRVDILELCAFEKALGLPPLSLVRKVMKAISAS
jgi:transcriptional regulator with XRE-family HTH domain